MRQGGGMARRRRRPAAPGSRSAPNPFDNPFGKVLKDMFGGGGSRARAAAAAAPTPMPVRPTIRWARSSRRCCGGGQRRAAPSAGAGAAGGTASRAANPSGGPRNPYDDLFGEMFETGRQQRDDYQKGMESIFDQFKQGMDRYR